MGARTGLTCIRQLLCILNVTIWFMGSAIMAVGIWLRVAYGGYATLLHQYEVLSLDSLCLATGVITFVVSFFACCGAWFRNRCMLMTYFVLLTLVFTVQVVVAILVFAFRETITTSIRDELKAGIKYSYNDTTDNGVAYAWDKIQRRFQCCGVDGYSDWFHASEWPRDNFVLNSCCKDEFQNCGKLGDLNLWYSTGCFDVAQMWFIKRLHIVGFTILVIAFIQLFGLISSMLLYCSSDHKRRSRTYRSYQMES